MSANDSKIERKADMFEEILRHQESNPNFKGQRTVFKDKDTDVTVVAVTFACDEERGDEIKYLSSTHWSMDGMAEYRPNEDVLKWSSGGTVKDVSAFDVAQAMNAVTGDVIAQERGELETEEE